MWGTRSKHVAKAPDATGVADIVPPLPSGKWASTTGDLPTASFTSAPEFESAGNGAAAPKSRFGRLGRFASLAPRSLVPRTSGGRSSGPSSASGTSAPETSPVVAFDRLEAHGLDREEIKELAESCGWWVVEVLKPGVAAPELPTDRKRPVLIMAETDRLEEATLLVSYCRLRAGGGGRSGPTPAAPLAALLMDCRSDEVSEMPLILEAETVLLDGGANDVLTNANTPHGLRLSLSMALLRCRAHAAAISDATSEDMLRTDGRDTADSAVFLRARRRERR